MKNNVQTKRGMVWMQYAISLCVAFSISVSAYTVIAYCMGEHAVSVMMVLSLALICAIGTLIQLLCFSTYVWRNLRYTWRLLLFGGLFLPVLAICAVAFAWFPIASHHAWIGFFAVYLVLLLLITAVFEAYYRLAGKKYDGILGQYRARAQARDASQISEEQSVQ